MIRDPSDGSVRHHPKPLKEQPIAAEKPVLGTTSTGLPPLDKDHAGEAARLNRSRKWLENYRKRRGAS